ncbi:uncharacterized protein LOC111340968 [Stylophora pistillata]|uniref:uncharacterized protein LOC111340968 n=1 Tax=Stylophora pistillata TaxID=50429 RepID=UPI000C03F251|nr:uncharacterized protein LOC111340968 [Stylophora pistillata]
MEFSGEEDYLEEKCGWNHSLNILARLSQRISVVCLLVPVQYSESKSRRETTLRSGYCNLITSGRCLMKIGAGSTGKRRVSIDGAFTTDLATRFTIVKIKDSSGKTRGKCIEFTTSSQVKYALKVVNPSNIVFEKKPKGCDYTNISDDFIFKESRHYRMNYFTYTYNSKCLAAKTDGKLFLKTIKDVSKDNQCKYSLHRYS